MHRYDLSVLEGRIGYRFRQKSLLETALTHSSFANEQKNHIVDDYERLEFLGDSILEMVSSAFLYNKYPEKREGELTRMRASLVCEPSLCFCAGQLGFAEYLRLGSGEEATGGRHRESILADVVEAVIGAIWMDCGELDPPRNFILQHVLCDAENRILFYDAKTVLQERAQAKGLEIRYEILSERGPEHDKHYLAGVYVGGTLAAQGEGRSKKSAEQQAAYAALRSREQEQNVSEEH